MSDDNNAAVRVPSHGDNFRTIERVPVDARTLEPRLAVAMANLRARGRVLDFKQAIERALDTERAILDAGGGLNPEATKRRCEALMIFLRELGN